MKEGLLIVLSGPSGAGKGTLCKELCKKNQNYKVSISMTTRKPRKGEIDGKNYFFVSEQKFKELVERDKLLEWARVFNNYYGTPKEFVERELDNGNEVILEIDIQGALKVKEKFPKGVYIFILPPSMEELKQRIIKRGTESPEEINKRFNSAYNEINYITKYDYVVINDDVNEAIKKIQGIITAEKCRVDRNMDILKYIREGC